MPDQDQSEALQDQVKSAISTATPIQITGSGSKHFYGETAQGEPISTTGHCGVLNYQPSELVITARAGTPMQDIESLLDQHQQQLPFEPPWFGDHATLGGVVATGLSGPNRISAGATRDFILGTRLINGQGEILRFGSEVMKNVAGYDVSRLMTGAMGTLGLLLDVSVKTLPKPAVTRHLCLEMDPSSAIQHLNQWAAQPRPISASCQIGNTLHLRLAGHAADVDQTTSELGGEVIENQPDFWTQLREQQWPFFGTEQTLWRLSLPPATQPLALSGETLYEWHGAQRWLVTDEPASRIRSVVESQGGHATQFRHADPTVPVFHPLPDSMMQLHRRLKQSFDPHGLFNPGRMYPDL